MRTEIHLDAADTGGAFSLLVDCPPPGWSLQAHRHRDESETIHIVEGHFEMEVDGIKSRLLPGETIHVPKGVVHSGANTGRQAGRRLVLFSPSGIEDFFREVGTPTLCADTDISAVLASADRHGWEFLRNRSSRPSSSDRAAG